MFSLTRRVERLEQQLCEPGAGLRFGEQQEKTDWYARLEQSSVDSAAGITPRQRAQIDLQRTLTRYPHPDDKEIILYWHNVHLCNIAQWEALHDD